MHLSVIVALSGKERVEGPKPGKGTVERNGERESLSTLVSLSVVISVFEVSFL